MHPLGRRSEGRRHGFTFKRTRMDRAAKRQRARDLARIETRERREVACVGPR